MGLKPRAKGYRNLTISSERLTALRECCLAFEGAEEKVAWGDPTWRVGGKIFAMQKGNYDGGRPSVWFKGADGAQAMLVSLESKPYFVPPYVGHKGWVGAYLDWLDWNDDRAMIDWEELGSLIAISYELVARRR